MHFELAYFYFVLIHLELKRYIHPFMYPPVVHQKPYPIPDQNGESVLRPKRPKNPYPLGYTYLYGLYAKGVPPHPEPLV